MTEPMNVTCPSCDQILAAVDEGGLVNVLQEHLYEEHALEMPPERVRENVAAQLRDFDGYNARPISGPDEPPRVGGSPGGGGDRVACP